MLGTYDVNMLSIMWLLFSSNYILSYLILDKTSRSVPVMQSSLVCAKLAKFSPAQPWNFGAFLKDQALLLGDLVYVGGLLCQTS